jgi:hypothetical protein
VFPHFHGLNVYGTKGTFHHHREAGLLYTSANTSIAPERFDQPYRGYRRGDLIPSFVDAIVGDGPPMVATDEVFRTMAVCFAIDRSAVSGRPEPVEEL